MKDRNSSRKNGGKHRVFLVEDHPVMRAGFAQLVNFQDDLAVCGQAGSTAAAIREIPDAKPDLVIVDISLPDGGGIDLIKDLAARDPGLPCIVFSTHDEKIYAERALRAGARGYIMKQEPVEHVLKSIRAALRGEICVSDAMRSKLLGKIHGARNTASGVEQLSDRELDVFRLLGGGHGTAEIATRLHVSVSTVETYRANIKQKLGLKNAMDLVAAAVRWVEKHA